MLQRTGQTLCHVRVRDVAKAAAGELYERLMGDDKCYDAWKKQNPGATAKQLEKRFIEKKWPLCVEFARASLATLLGRPDVAAEVKEEIMDVLEKDQMLRGKGAMPTIWPAQSTRH